MLQLQQSASGILEIEIGGDMGGLMPVPLDFLYINGSASLGGSLDLRGIGQLDVVGNHTAAILTLSSEEEVVA